MWNTANILGGDLIVLGGAKESNTCLGDCGHAKTYISRIGTQAITRTHEAADWLLTDQDVKKDGSQILFRRSRKGPSEALFANTLQVIPGRKGVVDEVHIVLGRLDI